MAENLCCWQSQFPNHQDIALGIALLPFLSFCYFFSLSKILLSH